MANNTEELISMSDAEAQAPVQDGLISMNEVETGTPDAPAIKAIPEEYKGQFLLEFGSAFQKAMEDSTKKGLEELGYAGKRVYAGAGAAAANINHVLGYITGLNSFKKYRDFVQGGIDYQQQVLAEKQEPNLFERSFYGLADSIGYLAPTIPIDVITGGATKVALAGRILPKIEGLLARMPNFVLGSGWRGMVEGIEASGDSLPEKVVGGIVGAGETMAVNTLYANAGVGLKGIGKMASLGAANAFYNAAKEGRVPTAKELIDQTTQAGLLGVVFTMLPHLVEGSKIAVEKEALSKYSKKFERTMGDRTSDPTKLHKLATDLLTDEAIRPEIRESLAQPFLDLIDQRGGIADPDFMLGMWKDRSKLRMSRETMERNIENVAGKDAGMVKLETTEKIKENETFHRRWQTEINNQIEVEFTARGIKPNSKESTATMAYGEGRVTEASLQVDFPGKWQNIKKAAEFSRQVYDDTLKAVNLVRERYGYEPIAKREDYFRHFQEINVASQLFGHFLGGEKPPTSIAGVVNRAKYGKPFTSTELQRLGGEFKEDAVLALQNYVKSVGPQLFHLDSVQRVRTLERYIRAQALVNEAKIKEGQVVAGIDLSNFTEKLSTYADLLAGQPTLLTQTVNRWFDRPVVAGIRALQRNVVLNMIGSNISAAFMNFLPVAQQIATTNPKAIARGWVTSVLHLQREVPFELDGVRSEFYDRRYPKGFLPANWQENVADKGFILPNVADRMTVQALIAGKFYENREKGMDPKAAMKAADNYAVRIVTDRSTGQVPSIMTEPDLKLISAFQVEINNLWSWLAHDIPIESKGKFLGIAGRITAFALASNVINNVYEKMMGRRPQLDFLYILGTLAGATKSGKDRGFLDRVIPAGKDLIGNIPFGNLFVQGGRFPIAAALPDMNVVLEDPEHRALSEFMKPLYYGLPFGGGGQARKTIEGLQAWGRGYVATPSQNIRYEIQKDFYNFVRAFLFGKNAFPEAVKYWNEPKSER